jgi:hypothetical protein
MGHYATQCPHRNENENRKHHAQATNIEDPISHKKEKDEEFIFVSTLMGTITQGSDTWLVDSGASKNMTVFKSYLTKLIEKRSSLQVELGDDSRHIMKGTG